jgi:hypothetical protein
MRDDAGRDLLRWNVNHQRPNRCVPGGRRDMNSNVAHWHFSDMLPQSPHVCCRRKNGPSSDAPRGQSLIHNGLWPLRDKLRRRPPSGPFREAQ